MPRHRQLASYPPLCHRFPSSEQCCMDGLASILPRYGTNGPSLRYSKEIGRWLTKKTQTFLQDVFIKMVYSMRRRCVACVADQDGHTG